MYQLLLECESGKAMRQHALRVVLRWTTLIHEVISVVHRGFTAASATDTYPEQMLLGQRRHWRNEKQPQSLQVLPVLQGCTGVFSPLVRGHDRRRSSTRD